MKKCILLFVGLLLVGATQAQFKFGIKAGVGTSTLKMDDLTIPNLEEEQTIKSYLLEQSDAVVGMHFGGVIQVSFASIFIQPELLFSTSGGKVNVKETLESGEIVSKIKKQSFNKIDLPIMAGWKLGPLRLGLGPVASVVVGSKTELIGSAKETYKKATWGYQLGAGVDILDKIGLDFRYEGALSKLGESVELYGQEFSTDTRTSQLKFSVSYYF